MTKDKVGTYFQEDTTFSYKHVPNYTLLLLWVLVIDSTPSGMDWIS